MSRLRLCNDVAVVGPLARVLAARTRGARVRAQRRGEPTRAGPEVVLGVVFKGGSADQTLTAQRRRLGRDARARAGWPDADPLGCSLRVESSRPHAGPEDVL